MKLYVTRFDEKKARVFQNGKLKAFDLVPEEIESDMVFHSVKLDALAVTEPEENDVNKTFLILKGSAVIRADGKTYKVFPGDVLWLPKDSVHIIENGSDEMEFIVVKKKGKDK